MKVVYTVYTQAGKNGVCVQVWVQKEGCSVLQHNNVTGGRHGGR